MTPKPTKAERLAEIAERDREGLPLGITMGKLVAWEAQAQTDRRELLSLVRDLQAERDRITCDVRMTDRDICNVLGKALGYPLFFEDQKNFPGTTEADGVCVGEHVPLTLADEAAERIRGLQAERDRLKKLLDRDHTGLAAGLNAVRQACKSYGWIPSGEWGSYEWHERTEQAFREEIGRCFDEVERLALLALNESGLRANAAFHPEADKVAALEAENARLRDLAAKVEQAKEIMVRRGWFPLADLDKWAIGPVRGLPDFLLDLRNDCPFAVLIEGDKADAV